MKLKLVARIKDGVLFPETRLRVADFIKECFKAGLPCVQITVEPFKGTRSTEQNAYYWGVVIDRVKRLQNELGITMTPYQVHHCLVDEVGMLKEMIPNFQGVFIERTRSTTELGVQEFEEYLEKVRAWAAENGCVIPLPEKNPSKREKYID